MQLSENGIYIFSATTLPVSNNLHKRNLVITRDGRPSRENNAKTTYASNACRARLTPFVPTNGINLQKRICIFLHPRASDAGNLLAKSLAGTSTGSCMDARLQKSKSDLMQRWNEADWTFIHRVYSILHSKNKIITSTTSWNKWSNYSVKLHETA